MRWLTLLVALLILLPLLAVAETTAETAADTAAERAPTAAELRRKTLVLNTAVAGGILAWGVINWEYFQGAPRAGREGWFNLDTGSGGADKVGHMYVTYVAGMAFRGVYLDWGYQPESADKLGLLSSLGAMTLMELGDSFSTEFGFSYEDALMNLAGAGFGYLMLRFPELDRKLDFRAEYLPEFGGDFSFDLVTDYEHLKYLLVLKGEGFDALAESWLRFLELHAGYYTRNFEDFVTGGPDQRERTLYVGVGLNVGKLLERWVKWPVFDYLQLPYTYLPAERTIR